MLDDSAEGLVLSEEGHYVSSRWSRFESWQRPMPGDRSLLSTGFAHGYDGSLMGDAERVYEPVSLARSTTFHMADGYCVDR